MSSTTHVSLPKTFDTGNASEWFQRFEICGRANGWANDKMALELPTLLEGEALAVWLELSSDEQKDYATTNCLWTHHGFQGVNASSNMLSNSNAIRMVDIIK